MSRHTPAFLTEHLQDNLPLPRARARKHRGGQYAAEVEAVVHVVAVEGDGEPGALPRAGQTRDFGVKDEVRPVQHAEREAAAAAAAAAASAAAASSTSLHLSLAAANILYASIALHDRPQASIAAICALRQTRPCSASATARGVGWLAPVPSVTFCDCRRREGAHVAVVSRKHAAGLQRR